MSKAIDNLNKILRSEEEQDHSNETDCGPESKRAKRSYPSIDHVQQPPPNIDINKTITERTADKEESHEFLDIPSSLNLVPGTRIQVIWDIYKSEHDELPTEHWWSATLLPYDDGRTYVLAEEEEDVDDENECSLHEDGVGETEIVRDSTDQRDHLKKPSNKSNDCVVLPLRRLDYDAYPEGGFPERSIEDVCFISDRAMFLVSTNGTTLWRLEGQTLNTEESMVNPNPPSSVYEDNLETKDNKISLPQDGVRSTIDTIIQSALINSGVMEKMSKLPASQQLIVAERIATSKEKLIAKMEQVEADLYRNKSVADGEQQQNGGGVLITVEHVRKCMEELKQELNM